MADVQMWQELKIFFVQALAERMENIFKDRFSGLIEEEEEKKGCTDLVDIKQREDEIFEKQICTLEGGKEEIGLLVQSGREPIKMESNTGKPENLKKDLVLQAEVFQRDSTLIIGIIKENSDSGEHWQDLIMDGKLNLRKSVWILIKSEETVTKGKSRYLKDWRKKKKNEYGRTWYSLKGI